MKGVAVGKLRWLVLDFVALCYEALKYQTLLVKQVDQAEAVDNSDDPHWRAADEALNRALEFMGKAAGPDKAAVDVVVGEIHKALNELRRGEAIDFSDGSLGAIKGEVMPQVKAFETLLAAGKKLAEELEGNQEEKIIR